MEDIPIPGRDDERRLFNEFAARHGEPAFARRARRMEEALQLLLERCHKKRDKLLEMARLHVGTLKALAGEWTALRPWLADDQQLDVLQRLHDELKPTLRVPVERTSSARKLRHALRELTESIERFNERWHGYLREVDLRPVNDQRDGYNRWYLLEKECALRSPRLARLGFRPMEPLTFDELTTLLPPLPVPRLAE